MSDEATKKRFSLTGWWWKLPLALIGLIAVLNVMGPFAPVSAQSGEDDVFAALKCGIANDRVRILDMIENGKPGLDIDVELEKHRQRLSELVQGQSQPVIAASACAYYATSQMVYKARHGNPFVIQQEVDIALTTLLDKAANMPDCTFSKDFRELIASRRTD